jgi:hypothetical protein
VDHSKPKDAQKELEILVNELEERVDRLRALYEQYFMGYEKLEPTIPRKDVDRRFSHLRKQQIRNTALRFKFNVITQKFQTYSMYWARICRQIEDGTYKRHVLKAARKFAEADAKKQLTDYTIDVDIAAFEDDDLDSLLAAVDAESAGFQRSAVVSDTVPPGMPSHPPPVSPLAASAKPRVVLRRRSDGDPATAEAGSAPVPIARPATLGSPIARPATPASPMAPAGAPASGSAPIARPATPAGPVVRPATPGGPVVRPATPASPIARPATPASPIARPATPASPIARPATPASPIARPAAPVPQAPAARPPTAAPSPSAPAARMPTPASPMTPFKPPGPLTLNRPAVGPSSNRIPLPSAGTTPASPAGAKPAPAPPSGAAPGADAPRVEPVRPAIRRTAPTPERVKKDG